MTIDVVLLYVDKKPLLTEAIDENYDDLCKKDEQRPHVRLSKYYC